MNRKTKALEFIDTEYNISITGRNVEITDSMRDYVMEKISKIEKFHNRIIDVNVIMEAQKLDHRVDIVMKVDHIKIKSDAASTDMYFSIDKAVDKLVTQLRRYKQRIRDHHAKSLNVIDMNVNVIRAPEEEDILEVNDDIESENVKKDLEKYRPHIIVGHETIPLKMLTYEEAIMKMELSGDTFLIFRAENDQKLNVIYRRKDGNYGVIQPEV